MINLIITENYDEMSRMAGTVFAAEILRRPDTVLGLATGSTPIGLYRELVKMYQDGILDFSEVTTFNLDEYVGLSVGHPQSYHTFMQEQLFSHINISPERVHIPDGQGDPKESGQKYEEEIAKFGPIRIQLLGLGHNGHIGFNEPADIFPVVSGEIQLTESTIEANQRFFDRKEDVPTRAVSMGIGTIMNARSIVLLVSGSEKAAILKEVLEGEVTPRVPGSILQFHPDVTVIADEEAARNLSVRARSDAKTFRMAPYERRR